MNRDLEVIKNGDIPATNSGVFIEYYALKGIALHPDGTFTGDGTDRKGAEVPRGLYLYRVDNGYMYSGKIMKIN
ncbi:MAG: hypothetical protein R6U78_05095 [Bacteroidales bacterium]